VQEPFVDDGRGTRAVFIRRGLTPDGGEAPGLVIAVELDEVVVECCGVVAVVDRGDAAAERVVTVLGEDAPVGDVFVVDDLAVVDVDRGQAIADTS
jgi:hypothetical protein